MNPDPADPWPTTPEGIPIMYQDEDELALRESETLRQALERIRELEQELSRLRQSQQNNTDGPV